jgi:hypothetical protein
MFSVRDDGCAGRRPRTATNAPLPMDVRSVRAFVADNRRGWACLAAACALARRYRLDRIVITPLTPSRWWQSLSAPPDWPLLVPEEPGPPASELLSDRIVLFAWEHGVDVEVRPPLPRRPPGDRATPAGELIVVPASWPTAAHRLLARRSLPYEPVVRRNDGDRALRSGAADTLRS